METSDVPLAPLGSMSTNINYGGYGYGVPGQEAEHIPDLLWPTSVATLNRMRTDPVIASILAAYTGPLLAADWRIDPRGADPAAVAICCDSLGIPAVGEDAKDIGAARRRGVKFIEHVRLAALHLVWGHMAFFPYYEVRSDGRAYLAGLPERMPSTITEIRVNDDGTLRSIVQEAAPGKATKNLSGIELPAKDLLFYTHKREGANWAGTALIRPCYSDWLLKIEGKRSNAVGLARFSAGTPVAEPLPGTNPTPAQIAEAQRMVSSIRVGQQGGAVPVGFKIRIIGIEGSLPDSLASLRYYDEQLRAGALVSVLDLGSSANGSRALGETFADLLKGAIQSVASGMAETATQLCERLTTMNFGEDAIPPAVTCGDVGASKAAIAASITGLVSAGLVTPDASLESFVRDGYHLPPKDAAPAPVPAEPVQEVGPVTASGWQPWVYAAEGGADRNRGNAEAFRRYWTEGPGAALIGYGAPGQFDRCVTQLEKHMSAEQAKGYCANRIKEVAGEWPGAHHGKVAAASGGAEQTGIMVALMVPPAEAEKLALDGGEPADDLHLTLVFLGKTTDVTDEAAYVGTVLNVIRDVAARHPVIEGEISGSGRFSTPDKDAVYLSYDSPDLPDLRQDLFDSLKAAGVEPVANHGFSPHITVAYVGKGEPSPLHHVDTSPLTFAGITFAYGGQQITAPLVSPEPMASPIYAAEPTPPAQPEPTPYREPTPQEVAAGIDPAQIDAETDGLVAEGMVLLAAIVAVWGAAVAAQIVAALGIGSLAALARLTVDSTDAAQGLAVLMREAADAGVRHVLDETQRAGIRAGIQPADVRIDEAALDDAAEAAAELMGQGFARAAGKEAARIGAGADPEEAARQAVDAATQSQTPIHDALAAEVTRAMGVGRTAAQQAVQLATGSQLLPFHSALRDRSTCLNCAAHDGTVYGDLAEAVRDFPSGHYANCLGRARCRCVVGMTPVTL